MSDAARVRVDKWLWCVRLAPTRTAANDACASGRVTVDDAEAKPATKIGPGARVTLRRRDRTIVVEVVETITKRVGAAKAVECYVDHSPPPEPREPTPDRPGVTVFARRDRGEGRPTKRDRRQLDRLRGRDDGEPLPWE